MRPLLPSKDREVPSKDMRGTGGNLKDLVFRVWLTICATTSISNEYVRSRRSHGTSVRDGLRGITGMSVSLAYNWTATLINSSSPILHFLYSLHTGGMNTSTTRTNLQSISCSGSGTSHTALCSRGRPPSPCSCTWWDLAATREIPTTRQPSPGSGV